MSISEFGSIASILSFIIGLVCGFGTCKVFNMVMLNKNSKININNKIKD